MFHKLGDYLAKGNIAPLNGNDPVKWCEVPGYGYLLGYGLVVPTDASTGWAKGAIFYHLDGSTRAETVYVNEGDTSSCNFDSMTNPVAADIALATGSMLLGAAGVAAALDVKGDGKIIVGNGTTATSVSVSGDATLANTGALTIATGAVEDSMIEGLAAGAMIVGTDGTAANNAKVAMSGDATMAGTGVVTLAYPVRALASQSLVYSAFTDNTDATGYIDFTSQLPAKALVLGWKAVVSAGFANDTTAVIQVGLSGALDKYSAVTNLSVLTPATVASSMKAGNVLEWTAVTPRVTVTGGSDFTSINAGTMVVTLYYILLS